MTNLRELEHEAEVAPERSRPRRRTSPVAIGLVVLLVICGLGWWQLGGTRLSAAGGGYGVAVPLGEDASFGIVLTKADGGRISLDAVTATVSPGATITWSVYQAPPGGDGFGTWHGELAPRWRTVAVAGYGHVSAGDSAAEGSTWIVGTVHATAPGIYQVSDVTIEYHSGWRARTVAAHTTACVLAYPSGTTFESLEAAADPLVTQYHDCNG